MSQKPARLYNTLPDDYIRVLRLKSVKPGVRPANQQSIIKSDCI